MFLKSIEIFGFKSFADRSVIEFSDGISALLGPNGCGKSNVVDAIRWVLGEQASRSLRAERMEDVIFNGTEERKPLNVAEVTLTLSNETGILPLDAAEIAVKRRLFRSGESEYSLNGGPVKLRELRELFYDTGVGKTAYSIMEQGKIDQVLSNKPEERRLIFEEVAGITRYRIRGKEAERKLERTEENMRQVQSILTEVGRSYENLRKQSEKTLAYRSLRAEAFQVELDMTLLKLRGLVDERDKRTAQMQERAAARDGIREAIDRINESLETSLDEVNTMESSLIEQQKRLYGVELEKNNRENQIRIHNERVSELQEKIVGDEARQRVIQSKIESLREEIASLAAAIADHRTRIADVDRNIGDFTGHVEVASAGIEENGRTIAGLERRIEESEAGLIELEQSLRQLTDVIVQQLDEGLAASGYSQTHRKQLEVALRSAVAETTTVVRARVASVRDAVAAGADSALTQAVDRLTAESAGMLDSLGQTVESYIGSIPAFLDDFLAPQGIITRKREVDAAMEQARESVRADRTEIARLGSQNATLSERIQEYRSTLEELRLNRVRMSTQSVAMEETVRQREGACAEQERALEQHRLDLEQSRSRLGETRRRIESLAKELGGLESQEKTLQKDQKKLEQNITARNKELMEKERGLKQRMEDLGRTQNSLERLQMSVAETNAEIRNLYENFRERFSQELSEHEPRMLELTGAAADLRQALTRLREQERSLGAVNLAAPEEFEEVRQRYEFLNEQVADLRKAREDLEHVTREIERESAELFTETYEQVKRNFHIMYRRLFGGGRGELKLLDPGNVLESGIDIFAQPPGKKLENIALLSGGERSLTAVALLFATYMVRSSPFCLLDEIDAALDESSVSRFTNMLAEFGTSSQFIIITHNKKTVTAATTLLGVTMEESGVSKVVAIRIGGREEVHAG